MGTNPIKQGRNQIGSIHVSYFRLSATSDLHCFDDAFRCGRRACRGRLGIARRPLPGRTTGIYGNRSDWRGAVPNRKTIMQQLMAAGYDVRGAGKIFHHHLDGAFHDDASFHHFQPMPEQQYPPQKLNAAPRYGSRNTDWGAWPKQESDAIDYHTASYCVEALGQPDGDKPRFLACGIYKPHSPFFAPASYHESYQNIVPPVRRPDDWKDLPSGADSLLRDTKWFWQGMTRLEQQHAGSYQAFIRSYAACAAFADAQIGRLLDALDNSPRRDRTIVVLWSDHGFHLGEKDHIAVVTRSRGRMGSTSTNDLHAGQSCSSQRSLALAATSRSAVSPYPMSSIIGEFTIEPLRIV
jgi:arylsulfatase A-like enzyme